MKALIDPLFICYCIVWTVIKLWRLLGVPPTFLNSYLTDLVAVPLIAHIVLVTSHSFFIKCEKYTLIYLLFLAAYISFVFEWLMPRFSTTYTSDWADIVCYCIGAVFYHSIHMPRTPKCRLNVRVPKFWSQHLLKLL